MAQASSKTSSKSPESENSANESTSKSGYDHAQSTLVIYTRENAATKLVQSAYKFDPSDPIGYNPVLKSCNTKVLPAQTLQQFRTDDTYEVFEKNSLYGGTKDRQTYRRYNNAADCTYVRKRGVGIT